MVGLSGVGLMLHCYSSIPLLSFGIGNLVCGVSGHGYDSCFFLWVCGGEREFFFPFPTHNQCHSNANGNQGYNHGMCFKFHLFILTFSFFD